MSAFPKKGRIFYIEKIQIPANGFKFWQGLTGVLQDIFQEV
ncbi:MAG: hypothetical protein RMJ44_11605 [Cytophagales bacterium]|nr:hypothetical protein [Cytophagales bacterium]